MSVHLFIVFFKKKNFRWKKNQSFYKKIFFIFGPKPPPRKGHSINNFPLRGHTISPPPPTQSHGSLPDHLLPHSSSSVFPQWELEVRTLKIVHNNCTPFLSSTIHIPASWQAYLCSRNNWLSTPSFTIYPIFTASFKAVFIQIGKIPHLTFSNGKHWYVSTKWTTL